MSFVEVTSQPNPTSQQGPGPWSIHAFIPPSLSVDQALGSSPDTEEWIGQGSQGSCVLVARPGEHRNIQICGYGMGRYQDGCSTVGEALGWALSGLVGIRL